MSVDAVGQKEVGEFRDPELESLLHFMQEVTFYPVSGDVMVTSDLQASRALSKLGYYDCIAGQAIAEMPVVLGDAQNLHTFVPDPKKNPEFNVRGFTSMIAGAPRLSFKDKVRLIDSMVFKASNPQQRYDEWSVLPQVVASRATSPRKARKAALSQLNTMSGRQEFRRRSGQNAFPENGLLLRGLEAELRAEWRVVKPEQAVMVATVAGAAALAFVTAKKRA